MRRESAADPMGFVPPERTLPQANLPPRIRWVLLPSEEHGAAQRSAALSLRPAADTPEAQPAIAPPHMRHESGADPMGEIPCGRPRSILRTELHGLEPSNSD